MQQDTQEYLDRVVVGVQKVVGMVRQDTFEALKGSHVDAIRHFHATRIAVEKIKEAKKALDEIEDQLSKNQIPDIMRRNEVKTITIEGVGRVTVANRVSCSMPDKALGFQWLRDNGHDGLIQETVNSSSLSAFAKEMMEDKGVDLPDDIFKISINSYTSITKVK